MKPARPAALSRNDDFFFWAAFSYCPDHSFFTGLEVSPPSFIFLRPD